MLYLHALKGLMGEVSVKYIIVWIDDANKMEGCLFFELFRPHFTLLLNQFRISQHKLLVKRFQYVL